MYGTAGALCNTLICSSDDVRPLRFAFPNFSGTRDCLPWRHVLPLPGAVRLPAICSMPLHRRRMYIANLHYATAEFLRERILTRLGGEFSRIYMLIKNCPFKRVYTGLNGRCAGAGEEHETLQDPGLGPAPKDPRDRARQNAPSIPWRIIDTPPSLQPPLPATTPDGSEWSVRTRPWWAMWGSNRRAVDYHSTDWAMLLETAVLHARFWLGDTSVAGELRLRVAKHGATPLDRARCRAALGLESGAERRPQQPSTDS
jgi:hypothetical protein